MQQGTLSTDLFIGKVRALLAYLPSGDLSVRVQLDIDSLGRRTRKRLDRGSLKTICELLNKPRTISESLKENTITNLSTRKFNATAAAMNLPRAYSIVNNYILNEDRVNTSKLRVTNSDIIGTALVNVPTSNSNVTACDTSASELQNINVASTVCHFPRYNSNFLIQHDLFYVLISILGARGMLLIDTAAKRSVANCTLFNILKKYNQPFVASSMSVKLADGSLISRCSCYSSAWCSRRLWMLS